MKREIWRLWGKCVHLPTLLTAMTWSGCSRCRRRRGRRILRSSGRRTFDEARQAPLRIERREIASPHAGMKAWEVEFDSLDGVRIGGWITMPADGKFARGVVAGHGYGGRPAPEPCEAGPPAVSIYPCARGFDRSARADIPNHAAAHVRHGIGSRETYVHRGCVADLWCAASALIELYPEIADALHYRGWSFGGGIGALALP